MWWSTFNGWSMCVRLKLRGLTFHCKWSRDKRAITLVYVHTTFIFSHSPVIWSYNQSTQIACHISVLPSQTYQQIQCNRHGLMLLWFKDLMNVTKEVTIYRPNVLTLLSSAFIRVDLIAATRGPFIQSLISCLFSDEV